VIEIVRPQVPTPLAQDEAHVWCFRESGRERVFDLVEFYCGTRQVERTQRGKPFVPGSEVRFNLSHSGELTVCAFARGREVGIDVELESRKTEPLRLAERFFAPDEAEAVRRDGREAFFRIWVRKEAYVKALGLGIAGIGLHTFSAFPGERRIAEALLGDCLLWDLDIDPGYVAALAANCIGLTVQKKKESLL
jgi:4'-phosphopantetheinyl transferase